ncbi:MAG: HAMP domain-containing protein [Actinobacteria bacterium]|uniref:histidine kinase n=1 Tax=freshwater metagenome TaxID=449393 RepID=A0A6J7G6B7_9ZZZZ|nr:HAMP domain-containing protein [Actinomycetota bacterium]MTB27708.1 HAMP domain-containing protein [Actinomycetota bacterium]
MASSTKAPVTITDDGHDDRHINLSLRWKLTFSFVGLFTVIFAFIGWFILDLTANTTQDRLSSELTLHVEGATKTVNGDDFSTLNASVPAVPDAKDETGFGYPTSPLYKSVAADLFTVYNVVKAGTYTWFKDPKDGKLYTSASSGYYRDPQTGYHFKVPLADVTDDTTYSLMTQGLTKTTQQPAYTDAYGSWISTYTPILDKSGKSVGGIGQDYSLDYVAQVQADVRSKVLPALIISYIVLVGLVLLISTNIVRRLKRLTVATSRIADGEYDLNVKSLMRSRLRDEMYTLAESFALMASKVAAREQSLKQEVTRLKVEIDHARRTEAVKEITESEGFADIAAKAAEMRRRMREEPTQS